MTHDRSFIVDVKIGFDDVGQLLRYVRIHPVIVRPGLGGRVHVKPGPRPKIPRVVFTFNAWTKNNAMQAFSEGFSLRW